MFLSMSGYSQVTTVCNTGTISPSGGGNPSFSTTTCWNELTSIPTQNVSRPDDGQTGGGSGGAQGPNNGSITDVPDNENNGEPNAQCSDIDGVRINHARGDLGPNILSYRRGSTLRIHYSNGESELFTFVSYYSTIPAIPIAGTCR